MACYERGHTWKFLTGDANGRVVGALWQNGRGNDKRRCAHFWLDLAVQPSLLTHVIAGKANL